MNRKGLAEVLGKRLDELAEEGVDQVAAAEMAGCGTSTLRHMQNGTGTSHYGHELLTRVAAGLGLPEGSLVKAFYPPVPRDPASQSDAEVMVQLFRNQFEPYLAKIDAIPALQTDVAGLRKRLDGVAQDVHEVRSRLEGLVDINHQPLAD